MRVFEFGISGRWPIGAAALVVVAPNEELAIGAAEAHVAEHNATCDEGGHVEFDELPVKPEATYPLPRNKGTVVYFRDGNY